MGDWNGPGETPCWWTVPTSGSREGHIWILSPTSGDLVKSFLNLSSRFFVHLVKVTLFISSLLGFQPITQWTYDHAE